MRFLVRSFGCALFYFIKKEDSKPRTKKPHKYAIYKEEKMDTRSYVYLPKEFEKKEIEGGWELCRYRGLTFGTVEIPAEIEGKPVISLGKNAFHLSKVKHVIVPGSVKYIKEGAFENSKLQSIYLHDGTEVIEKEAFSECKSLCEVRLPNTLKTIKDGAFKECKALKTLRLPDGLEEIGRSVFSGSGIERVFIPKTVKSIGFLAFHCPVAEVVFEDGCAAALDHGIFDLEDSFKSLYIPDSITQIHGNLFEKVDLQFYRQYKRDEDGKKVRDAWGNEVTETVSNFYRRSGAPKELTIYCNEGSAARNFAKNIIAKYADCAAAAELVSAVAEGDDFSRISPDALYKDKCVLTDDEIFNETYDPYVTYDVVVPANIKVLGGIKGDRVKSITFEQGNQLEIICDNAVNSKELERISLEPCKKLKFIGSYAFSSPVLKSFTLPMDGCLEHIGSGILGETKSNLGTLMPPVTIKLKLPATVKHIAIGAFAGAPISELDLSLLQELEEIPANLCYRCSDLKKVILPYSGTVKRIGAHAFYDTRLREFDFRGIEYIGDFAYNTMKKAIIPMNCKIERYSFNHSTFIEKQELPPPGYTPKPESNSTASTPSIDAEAVEKFVADAASKVADTANKVKGFFSKFKK